MAVGAQAGVPRRIHGSAAQGADRPPRRTNLDDSVGQSLHLGAGSPESQIDGPGCGRVAILHHQHHHVLVRIMPQPKPPAPEVGVRLTARFGWAEPARLGRLRGRRKGGEQLLDAVAQHAQLLFLQPAPGPALVVTGEKKEGAFPGLSPAACQQLGNLVECDTFFSHGTIV